MVNVAKGARRIYPVEFDPKVSGLIERMSEEATRLYKVAIDAYVEQNANLAAALDDMDDELDEIHRDYIEAIFESHHASNLGLEAAVQLALVGRYYERIGDHAVNIGNRVEYMITGWLPEHSGAARHRAKVAMQEREIGDAAPRLRVAPDEDGVPGAEAG
jgi:phosphate transport system protein